MKKIQKWGRRLLCLVLCLMGFANVLPPAAEGQAAPDFDGIQTCLVRNSPRDSSSVIGQMENGVTVTVLGQQGSYYKVDCYDMTGYIAVSQVAQREDGTYFISCAPESFQTGAMPGKSLEEVLMLRASVLAVARQQLGTRYVYGGQRPGGFDCSGLTFYVYGKAGYGIERSASAQLQDGLVVSRESLQVGDLIFFRSAGSGYLASHVGIYAGNNQIIHAGNSGVTVASLSEDWFVKNYLCARRIIAAGTRINMPETAAERLLSRPSRVGIRTAE